MRAFRKVAAVRAVGGSRLTVTKPRAVGGEEPGGAHRCEGKVVHLGGHGDGGTEEGDHVDEGSLGLVLWALGRFFCSILTTDKEGLPEEVQGELSVVELERVGRVLTAVSSCP